MMMMIIGFVVVVDIVILYCPLFIIVNEVVVTAFGSAERQSVTARDEVNDECRCGTTTIIKSCDASTVLVSFLCRFIH